MKIVKVILLSILTLVPASIFSSDSPKDPILKIETGMHTAMIRRIGIDRAERYLVTSSEDKTIKVLELLTGRLIKTLRPPIGSGNEGKIYAVAVSPDGKYVAAGGWTGYEWEKSNSIYIFDINTGRIIKRISGLPSGISHLTYSKDGKYLAAGLGRKDGIRVYRTLDYSLVKEDKDYADGVYGIDFSNDSWLATTSRDGYIRLYDKDLRLIKKKKATGGELPFQISFSPDGSLIAVGYVDIPNVEILSAKTLDNVYSPNTDGFSKCGFGRITFSSDGSYLYAGGTCQKLFDDKWKFIIRRWNLKSNSYVDIPVSNDVIIHILPLRDGGVVFGTGEPSFGIVDASGRLALYKGNEKADLRDQYDVFQVSYDGSVVRFGYEQWGKTPVVFDAEKREFIDESSVRLLKPITQMQGIEITDWKHNYYPKLNGEPIKLEQYERSRSLAISPDGKRFLLGADWYLRLFDRDGNEIWSVPVPGAAWVVNIAGNGKVTVAGFGDGTIRWYRMEDGKELLALFPHRDRKRWVIWTPKGYYDASPGGEELIGWHINNGKDESADFFPASRFRNKFYRSDVIAKIFTTYDEEKAIALANEESGRKAVKTEIKDILPPVITILSPADGSTISKSEITIRYAIKNPSKEPVANIQVLIDGRPVSQTRGLKIIPKDEETGEITIAVPEKDFELSLIAENKYAASAPSTVRLYWKGEAKKEEFVIKPKLYIFAIGISKYQNKELQLNFASKDAKDFVEAMNLQKGNLYQDVIVKLITDEEATKDNILDGLEWLERQVTSKDVAMLFFAGHGINDPSGVYYFLPANADLEKLKRTAVAYSDIKNTVSSLAGKVVMFVDTCHSGNVFGGKRAITDITGVINELSSAENGVVVFASSTGRQYSLEDPAWGNGAFTKALIEGIKGKGDLLNKGKITINTLDAFIAERVKELTKGKQTPVTTKPQTVPDFPIAVKIK